MLPSAGLYTVLLLAVLAIRRQALQHSAGREQTLIVGKELRFIGAATLESSA
jgi:hypothetical protein